MMKNFIIRWVAFILIAVVNFIIGYRTAISFFYFFFAFLFFLMVISVVWVMLTAFTANITVTRKVTGKVTEDDTLEIKIVIRNKAILPLFNVILEDKLPCTLPEQRNKFLLIGYLPAQSIQEAKYDCICPQRGKYELGPFTVYFFDPLGLFFFKKSYPGYSEVYVYPKTFSIKSFPAMSKGAQPWFGINTARASGDEDEFFGVREYKEGDPIKRIHWASTAKQNRLIVKQFQNQSFYRATVIFNLEKDNDYGQGKSSITEYTVKIAASVCKYLFEQNVSIELLAHAGEIVHIPFNKGEEHLDSILKFLAVARAESGVGLREIIGEFLSYIPDDTTLITIASVEDLDYIAQMLPLAKGSISLIPLVLVSSTFLYPSVKLDKASILKDVKINSAGQDNFTPLFFISGVDPAESFLNIPK